jgi:hypothetical protein
MPGEWLAAPPSVSARIREPARTLELSCFLRYDSQLSDVPEATTPGRSPQVSAVPL